MRISVFGLGYVGAVTGACLASRGHCIVGVDVDGRKSRLFASGEAPVVEPGLSELLSAAARAGSLEAADAMDAIAQTDMTIVCVGTPSMANGNLDTSHIESASREIGRGLAAKEGRHTVVIRSTVLPGTVDELLVPILNTESGKRVGSDFAVCMVPEFLREGTAIADFSAPPFTVIGQASDRCGAMVEPLFEDIDAPVFVTDLRTAEMVKYACNAFHGLKVGFANEMGRACKSVGVDARKVMDIFCHDDKLNLSSYYLRPAFAFGGSCLPKDLRALTYAARTRDVKVPILESILASNEEHLRQARELLLRSGYQRIGFLGLSFKAGTDDLRESPTVELVEGLLGKGRKVSIYDRNVVPGRLVGANKRFIEEHLPHLEGLLCETAEEVVAASEVVVVSNADPAFRTALESLEGSTRIVLDLVGTLGLEEVVGEAYVAICW